MIRAMIFDFDGVLVDSEPLHYQAFIDVLEPLGITFSYSEYVEVYLGFDDRDALSHALQHHAQRGLTPEESADLCQKKQQAFEAVISRGISPIPGAIELVRRVAAQMPVAIASGATRRDIDLILAGIMPDHPFAAIVTADDVAKSKPDPTTYRLAAEQLGSAITASTPANAEPLRPNQVVAIEDTAAGLASARSAGLWTLGVLTTCPASALHQAHRIVEDYGQITPEALQQWFGS